MGNYGPDVLEIQRMLVGSGFSPGTIDGIFEENARAAVIAFQKAHGLKANGVIDAAVRSALGLS